MSPLSLAGKKSPVCGKWKEFYFVIKYGEQKLLYYEREDVSCAIKYGQIQLCVYCTYILYMCVLCTYVCVLALCGGSLYSMPATLTLRPTSCYIICLYSMSCV